MDIIFNEERLLTFLLCLPIYAYFFTLICFIIDNELGFDSVCLLHLLLSPATIRKE
jgi:hypothetical protein